jgi:shikimate kinase
MNLFLIGYRGSGKSTIAPLIAELANCDWVDTDDIVEQSAQKSIARIFADEGEATFRRLETEAIASVSGAQDEADNYVVVSLGGGAITIPANQQMVGDLGLAVYLRGTAETLWKRISTDPISGQQRPNLTAQGGRAEVEQVLAARREIYDLHSDFQIDIDDIAPEAAAKQIYDWWLANSKSDTVLL